MQFLDDIKLLVDNSILYNGSSNYITQSAQKLQFFCKQRIEEKKDQLVRLEKAINPLLDDNSLIVLNYLLDKIFEKHIMTVENSFAFLKPVNKTKYRDYYEIVKKPIDLEQIKQKITTKKYRSKGQFIEDFELLYNNCLAYNGPNNSYTSTAQQLLNACKDGCENSEWSDQLQQIEDQIERAMQDSFYQDTNSNQSSSQQAASPVCPVDLTQSHAQVFANNQIISISKSKPKSSGGSTSNKNSAHQSSKKLNLQNRNFTMMNNISMKNSPKSSSDAEVYVDVESVDDKAVDMSALLGSRSNSMYNQTAGPSGGDIQTQDDDYEQGEIVSNAVYDDDDIYEEDPF